MELMSLHPLDDHIVDRFTQAALGEVSPEDGWQAWWPQGIPVLFERMRTGDERAANELTLALAYALGTTHPTFTAPGFGLTMWEARVDRGVGMYMRPPSRLFRDLGVELEVIRAMPIRLDTAMGMMGGAFVPSHLIPKVREIVDSREERIARRLREAEYDPVVALGLFREAIAYAEKHGLGLFEALDAVGPDGQTTFGGTVIIGSRERVPKDERKRIDRASEPPKKPGLISRILGRQQASSSNGHYPSHDDEGMA
jgi:hypothetical protein